MPTPPPRRRRTGITRPRTTRSPDSPPPPAEPPDAKVQAAGGLAQFLMNVAPGGGIGVAFLLYLGWRSDKYADPLAALTPDTLPAERIYALQGADFVVFWAVLVLPVAVLLAWFHSEIVHRLDERALRRLGRAGQLVGLLLLVGAGLLVLTAPYGLEATALGFPLGAYLGTLLVVYATVLVRRSRPTFRPVTVVLRVAVAVLVAALTLWVADKVAQYQGYLLNQERFSTPGALFDAVVHSKSRLPGLGVGVVERKLDSPDSEYKYEYLGLRLVKLSGGRYYFVDKGWTGRYGSVVVLPDTDAILVRFTR